MSSLRFISILFIFILAACLTMCEEHDSNPDPIVITPATCDFVQYVGNNGCNLSNSYPVSATQCCPEGYPFSFGGSQCYSTCEAAAINSNGATIYRYNDTGSGEFSLNGNWMDSSGNGVHISGSSGTFYAFSSTWQLFVDNGTVGVGSLKFKNISQLTSSTWNCQALFLRITSGLPDGTAWSNDGTILMSNDGSYFTVTATSPFSGTVQSLTYSRV